MSEPERRAGAAGKRRPWGGATPVGLPLGIAGTHRPNAQAIESDAERPTLRAADPAGRPARFRHLGGAALPFHPRTAHLYDNLRLAGADPIQARAARAQLCTQDRLGDVHRVGPARGAGAGPRVFLLVRGKLARRCAGDDFRRGGLRDRRHLAESVSHRLPARDRRALRAAGRGRGEFPARSASRRLSAARVHSDPVPDPRPLCEHAPAHRRHRRRLPVVLRLRRGAGQSDTLRPGRVFQQHDGDPGRRNRIRCRFRPVVAAHERLVAQAHRPRSAAIGGESLRRRARPHRP